MTPDPFTLVKQPDNSWWVHTPDGRVYRAGADLVQLWEAYQGLKASFEQAAERIAAQSELLSKRAEVEDADHSGTMKAPGKAGKR